MANISIRMEDKLKQQAEESFLRPRNESHHCYTIFVKQSIREQRIPFEITRETLNRETLAALREVEKMKRNPSLGKSFDDVDTMMEDLLK